MAVEFQRPIGVIQRQEKFSDREVGISHPDVSAFIKITDTGDIQIMADQATGIIISPSKGTIFLVGNVVKILTNEDEGFKWNTKVFNPHATTYSQPTLVDPKKLEGTGTYDKIADYLD